MIIVKFIIFDRFDYLIIYYLLVLKFNILIN